MKNLIYLLLVIFGFTVFGFRIMEGIEFRQNVKGILKRAADANTIEIANGELTKALDYLEENNLTEGHTSIVYETPDEDIGFWYKNLKASQQELQNLNSTSALERTNVLMKLRETLLDSGEKARVTIPEGLAVYPNNLRWTIMMWAAFIAIMIGIFMPIHDYEQKAKVARLKAAEEDERRKANNK